MSTYRDPRLLCVCVCVCVCVSVCVSVCVCVCVCTMEGQGHGVHEPEKEVCTRVRSVVPKCIPQPGKIEKPGHKLTPIDNDNAVWCTHLFMDGKTRMAMYMSGKSINGRISSCHSL